MYFQILNIFNERPNGQINIENQHSKQYRVKYFGLNEAKRTSQ